MPFRFGKRSRQGDLTPAQRNAVTRLERGEITAEEAARILGESTRREVAAPLGANPATSPDEPDGASETAEEQTARELVERIAREAYGDPPE